MKKVIYYVVVFHFIMLKMNERTQTNSYVDIYNKAGSAILPPLEVFMSSVRHTNEVGESCRDWDP